MNRLKSVKNLAPSESLEADFAKVLREKDLLERQIVTLDERVFELNALLQAGKGFSRILKLNDLLATLSEMMVERFSIGSLWIWIRDREERPEYKLRWAFPERFETEAILPDLGWFWQMVREGKVFSVRNLGGQNRFPVAFQKLRLESQNASLCVPLRKGADLVGILFLGTGAEKIRESEYAFLEEFAALASLNLDSVLKYERNIQMLRNTRALFEFQEKTVHADSEGKVMVALQTVLEEYLEISDFEVQSCVDTQVPASIVENQRLQFWLSGSSNETWKILIHKNENSAFVETDLELIRLLADRVTEALRRVSFQRAAITDRMTGLYNGRYFEERWRTCLDQSVEKNQTAVLAISDIDFFKKFNDTHGHAAGDEVLRAVAKIFQSELERLCPRAQVFRYGGEEFTIIFPASNTAEAFPILDEVRQTVEAAVVTFEGKSLKVTVSMGASEFPMDGKDPTELFKRADDALYQSKHGGRNRVTTFE